MNAQPGRAAGTGNFAGPHDKFWEMHDLLFETQDRLGDRLLEELTQKVQLDPAQLREALEKREFQPRVRADFAGGVRSGGNGTPTFFIGGVRHEGPYDFDSLVVAIEQASTSK